ncbi:P-loop NTPase fold protein [Curtobacterium sp. MCPF17_052]|uniref:KAP family P-loop NTPase fold protein n=1 Tax=Curtobacterium sp. MCPF17_052 TaxID=2175655 RepID=UPI0024DF49B1|nr:P-loop NTPase fold protein [Curtobacterium sp. MCPF17_052]WIB13306.1 P-loop NTPase fold protein [Curtobacterium sp. MCPF17_052]
MLKGKLNAQAGDWQWISFNPWYYGDTTSMQFGFFNELRSHMQAMKNDAAKDAVKNARDSFGSLMKSSAPFVGAIGGLVGVDASDAMKKLGDLIGGEESTTRALEQAKAALRKLDMPFIVVLDDLDRLDPGELLLVARLVRLVGRLPNVHYLLAYDERTLIDLLRASPLVGKDSGRAGDYLEKIVQLRFDMPPLRGKQVDDLINAQLNETLTRLDLVVHTLVLNRFQDTYDQALRGRFRTVRSIKRYFAQVGMVDPGVLRELDFSDYLLLTWLRVEEPSVYHWLPRNRAYVLNIGLEVAFAAVDQAKITKQRQATLFSLLESAGVAEEDRDSVVDVLIALFPVIRNDRDGAPRQANHFSSADGLRVNSSDYFDRYFALEVPPEDIANVAVAAGVEDLVAGNEDTDAAVRLRTAFREDPALVRRKLEITPQNAAAVAEWMLDAGQDDEDPNRWIGSLARNVEQLLAVALATTPPEALEGAVDCSLDQRCTFTDACTELS